jgi:hypothetical protein
MRSESKQNPSFFSPKIVCHPEFAFKLKPRKKMFIRLSQTNGLKIQTTPAWNKSFLVYKAFFFQK